MTQPPGLPSIHPSITFAWNHASVHSAAPRGCVSSVRREWEAGEHLSESTALQETHPLGNNWGGKSFWSYHGNETWKLECNAHDCVGLFSYNWKCQAGSHSGESQCFVVDSSNVPTE